MNVYVVVVVIVVVVVMVCVCVCGLCVWGEGGGVRISSPY